MPDIDPESPTYLEDIDIALNVFLSQTWVSIYFYVFEAVVILGLAFFVIRLNGVVKNSFGDQEISKVYYFFLGSLGIAVIQFVLSIFMTGNLIIFWVVYILNLAVTGLSAAGFYIMVK